MIIKIKHLVNDTEFELEICTKNGLTHSFFCDNPILVEQLLNFIRSLLKNNELVGSDSKAT